MQVLRAVRGTSQVEAELADIRRAVAEARASKGDTVLFRRRRHLPQLLWSIAMPIFQQYTGMNAFMFYGGLLLKVLFVFLSVELQIFLFLTQEPPYGDHSPSVK